MTRKWPSRWGQECLLDTWVESVPLAEGTTGWPQFLRFGRAAPALIAVPGFLRAEPSSCISPAATTSQGVDLQVFRDSWVTEQNEFEKTCHPLD